MIFRFLTILFIASPLGLARDGVEADPMGGSQSATTNSPVAAPAAESPPADPMGGTAPVENKEAVTGEKSEASPSAPVEDPMAGAAAQTSTPSGTNQKQAALKPPLTPEIANLNLPLEVEIPN